MASDLIRLATELDECGGVHRLTSLINCAVKRCMEHERRGEETGVGMSDKTAPTQAASRAPGRDEASGGIATGRSRDTPYGAGNRPSGEVRETIL